MQNEMPKLVMLFVLFVTDFLGSNFECMVLFLYFCHLGNFGFITTTWKTTIPPKVHTKLPYNYISLLHTSEVSIAGTLSTISTPLSNTCIYNHTPVTSPVRYYVHQKITFKSICTLVYVTKSSPTIIQTPHIHLV